MRISTHIGVGLLAATLALPGCFDEGPVARDDDYCHGIVDGTPCHDGNPCTVNDVCGLGVCHGEAEPDGVICDDGDACTINGVCTAGVCAEEPVVCDSPECFTSWCGDGGECVTEQHDEGAECDDGEPCTDDACDAAGECVGAPRCTELNGPCTRGLCNPETGECSTFVASDGMICDDGDPCTDGETCQAAECVGGVVLEDGAACDTGDICADIGECVSGACQAVPKDCSGLDQPCVVGTCSQETGECEAIVQPDGASCDDIDACTQDTVCSSGECGGGVIVCFCRENPDGTACDDGLACTTGDTCAEGACLGTQVDCTGSDTDCLEGVCDPDDGTCVAQARQLGTECDDGEACTQDDGCVDGECVGAPIDCSELSTTGEGGCLVGVCQAGACETADVPDDTPCDDASACTGGDTCQSGTCTPANDLCLACADKIHGDACDDGNGCTSNDACVQDGAILSCVGELVDCSSLDEVCLIGACNPEDGTCAAVDRPDGHSCDDGDTCTESDGCNGGACQGSPIAMCGATADGCEAAGDNDELITAELVDLGTSGTATLLGWIDPAGETDWYSVEVEAGTLLSATTQAHCGSTLDTVVTVLDADEAVLALIDGDNPGDFAAVKDVEISEAGTYYVAVQGYETSGAASYLLTLTSAAPPPCASDADCGCSDMTCNAGKCEMTAGPEVEPNDLPSGAVAMAVGESRAGVITAPTDIDYYRVTLTEGAPISVKTRGTCGGQVDTTLTVHDTDGFTTLAFNDDVGDQIAATVAVFVAPSDGDYYISVTESSLAPGGYILTIDDLTCAAAADCTCGDQTCDLSGPKGLCGPALTTPEPEDASTTSMPLSLGQRMHGRVDTPFDTDAYAVELDPGKYTLETHVYCGIDMDTELKLMDPSGQIEIAVDDASGEGQLSKIEALEISTKGTYFVVVGADGAFTGEYLVSITAAP